MLKTKIRQKAKDNVHLQKAKMYIEPNKMEISHRTGANLILRL